MDNGVNPQAPEEHEPLSLHAYPVDPIKTPPFHEDVIDEIGKIMLRHGGELEVYRKNNVATGCTLFFPAGTIKNEVYPRIHDSKWKIVFPDGYTIGEHEQINGKLSSVSFPRESFSEKIQKKYFKKK